MINIHGHTIDESKFHNFTEDSGPIVLDLGGYNGSFAKEFFGYFPNAFIISFEPTPGLCVSDRGRWITIQKAAWISDGEMEFNLHNTEFFNNSLFFKQHKRIKVQTADIVPLLRTFIFDLIKIDIEGAEYELIDHIIKSNALEDQAFVQLSIEFHDFLDHSLAGKTSKAIASITELGYKMQVNNNNNIDVLFT